MKSIVKLLLGVMLFSSINVYATSCSGTDLEKVNKAANGIKTNYMVNEGKVKKNSSEYEVFPSIDFTIYNLTNDIFVKITSDFNKNEDIVTYSKTNNGKYSFSSSDLFGKGNYYIEIFSNLDSCKADSVKKITLKKPYYNQNVKYKICLDNPDVPMCQKYITEDTGATEWNIDEKVKEYLEKNNITITNKSDGTGSGNFFKENWKILAISGGVIVLLVGGYIIISKRRGAL